MLNWQGVIDRSRQGNLAPPSKLELSDQQWRERLSESAYHVLRQQGTERPFSSNLCQSFETGVYQCGGCSTPLFESTTKFDSGTGWPSFHAPLQDNVIAYHADHSHGMVRVEVTCNVCDSHLGHVFPDGPEPSGLRYCINALALTKV